MRVGWLATYVQTQHDDFDDVVGKGAIPIVHDQDLAIAEARLTLDVGLTARFAAQLMVPVRLVSTSIVYRDGMGAPVDLVTPSTHHRDETLGGLADPMLLGSASGTLGPVRVTARAGFTIPFGRTENDPFELGAMGAEHQHIQMGTGTVNPVAALEAATAWDAWRLGGFVFTQQVVYENGKGYHAGDRYAAGLSLRRALRRGWSVRGGIEVQAETFERWRGVRHEEEGNQGRLDAMLAAGATWRATDAISFDASVKVPVVTRVVGGQLEMPAIVELGASWSIGGPARAPRNEDDHDHEHDHDHDHDHDHAHDDHEHDGGDGQHHHDAVAAAAGDVAGLDVVDLGPPGAAVELVPVPGKVTIFDFWAAWCAPCKVLEPALVELARAHPERVAVRRIDIVDWDSAVVARYLSPRGFDMPHVKIYDERGALVLERSSGPGQLNKMIEEVRDAVAARSGTAPASDPRRTAPEATPPTSGTPPQPGTQPQPQPGADARPPSPPDSPPRPPAAEPPPGPGAQPRPPPPVQRRPSATVEILVTENGFVPATVTVPRGVPVTLRLTRKTARTCATEIVLVHRGKRVIRKLPLDRTVELALTFDQAGTIGYACAMDMIRGTIVVK